MDVETCPCIEASDSSKFKCIFWVVCIPFNNTLIVGAPGIHKAFIFRHRKTHNQLFGSADFEQELVERNRQRIAFCRDTNAVAIWGKWAIVGAKGLEAVFIYKDIHGNSTIAGNQSVSNHTWVRWQRLPNGLQ